MAITDILKQIRKVKMDVLYLDLSTISDIGYDHHIYYKYFGDSVFQRTILDLIHEVLITMEDKKRNYLIKVLQEELLLCISDLKDFLDEEGHFYLITYFYANTNHLKTEKMLPFFKLIFEFREIELANNYKDLLEDGKIAMLVKAESINVQVSKITDLLLKIEKEIDQYQKSICYISKQDNILDDIYFTEGLSHEATIIQTDMVKEGQEENFMEEEVESKSFQLFNQIRNAEYNRYDLTIFLKEYTNGYDKDLLKSLQYDLGFYLALEKEEMECGFSPEEVDQAVEYLKEQGLEIPYIKSIPYDKLTERQKEMRKKIPMNREPILDKERLLFPYEFYSLYRFRDMINVKVNELSSDNKKEINTVKFHGTQTQFIELIKSLIVNENLKGKQKEIFEILSGVFDIQLNNPEKIISDIKNRNNGSETLFLNELQGSLHKHIQTSKVNK